MSLTDIVHRIDGLASSWEQFKLMNDQKLKEIESKGPATVEQLCKINSDINNCKERLDFIETAAQRPEFSSGFNADFSTNDKHFSDYIRKGIENRLSHKTLSGDDNDIGGYLVTPHIVKRINKRIDDSSPMRQICSHQKISTETLDYIIEDYDRADAGWSGEVVDDEDGGYKSKHDFAQDTSTPKIQKISITTYELYAQPQISQKLLDDAFVNVEGWLVEKIAEAFSKKENEAFIKGDGTFQPRGILSYEDKIKQLKTDKLDSDAIMTLYYSLNEYYSKNASFLMNRSTLKDIRLFKSGTGQYLWQPSLSLETPDTLMGIPVYQSADMPTSVIAVADFKQAYKIVDSRGMRVLRDPYTNKPYVRFFVTKRVGGEVVNTSAIKLLKIASKY